MASRKTKSKNCSLRVKNKKEIVDSTAPSYNCTETTGLWLQIETNIEEQEFVAFQMQLSLLRNEHINHFQSY